MVNVTVIIPVYNGEEYLEQCIRSVQNQTLKEIEILCVDDGSSDSTAQIIRQFALKDHRIRLLWQENQGAGPAKNCGLRNAKGKYITFLDADDYYLDADALEKMFTTCEEKNVLVCGSLRKKQIDGEEIEEELFHNLSKNNVNRMLSYLDYQMDYNYQSYMMKREFLLENSFYFPAYRRYEDPVFLPKVLWKAEIFIIADAYLYCYRQPVMITRFNLSNTYDLLKGIEENISFSVEHGLDILFENTVRRLEYEYLIIILKNIPENNVDILWTLLRLNETIKKQLKIENYMIRPLRGIFLRSSGYERRLLKRIYEKKRIAIYGAGLFGRVFFSYLKIFQWEEKVEAFIVSGMTGNCLWIENVPVIALDDFNKKEDLYILVAAGERNQEQMKEYLNQRGYENYELLDEVFLWMADAEVNSLGIWEDKKG